MLKKKNIGIIIENYVAGGADKVASDLIYNLQYKKLYLFANKDSDLKLIIRDNLPHNVELVYYSIPSTVIMGEFAARFKDNIKPIYFLLRIFNLIVRYPLFIYYVIIFYFMLKKKDIDCFFSNNGGYPAGEFNRAASVAFSFIEKNNYHIVHSLATKPFFAAKYIEFFIDRFLDKHVKFILVSNQAKDHLLQKRMISQIPIVIYNGVFDYALPTQRTQSKVRFLNIGLLSDLKNQVMLIESFKELIIRGYENIELFLIGDEGQDGYREKLEKKIVEYKLEDKVFLEGFQNPAEYYKNCHVFLLSSRVESFALVRVEAMSAGMPVITTDVGDAFMQVKSGFNGFVVEDKKQMVAAAEFYLKDRDKIDIHGQRSRQIYEDSYTIDKMIKKYQELIDNEV